jgi:hypothetical protein
VKRAKLPDKMNKYRLFGPGYNERTPESQWVADRPSGDVAQGDGTFTCTLNQAEAPQEFEVTDDIHMTIVAEDYAGNRGFYARQFTPAAAWQAAQDAFDASQAEPPQGVPIDTNNDTSSTAAGAGGTTVSPTQVSSPSIGISTAVYAIVLGVLGVVLLLALAVCAVLFLRKRNAAAPRAATYASGAGSSRFRRSSELRASGRRSSTRNSRGSSGHSSLQASQIRTPMHAPPRPFAPPPPPPSQQQRPFGQAPSHAYGMPNRQAYVAAPPNQDTNTYYLKR